MRIPFVGPCYETISREQNNQLLQNWYVVPDGQQGKNEFVMYPTPGLSAFSTLGSDSANRGMIEHKGTLYAVADNNFYSIPTTGTETAIGTLSSSTGRVEMAAIDDQIGIVDGFKIYIYTISTNTLTTVTDPDAPGNPQTITSQASRFIVPSPNTDEFFISELNDGTSWRAIDFSSAEGDPDKLVTCLAFRGTEVWLFGERTTEVWVNTGGTFPYERAQGVFILTGTSASYTPRRVGDTLMWLGQNTSGDSVVYMANGYNAQMVSTPALNRTIADYSTINDAYAFSYQKDGFDFYVLTFPTADATWVYNLQTNLWHKWVSINPDTGEPGRHRAIMHAHFNHKNLIADEFSGVIYELDNDTYTDAGQTITRKRIGPPLSDENKLIEIDRLDIDFEDGVGLQSGQGSNPLAMLRVSKDGGKTWGNRMDRSVGAVGNYQNRVLWTRLGKTRNLVLELTCTDPVKWIVLGAYVNEEN